MDAPKHLKYATTHEWAALQDDGSVQVGISDFAQEQLGDLVYLQLPEVGAKLVAGEACAVVESVKTASDLHSPITGEVTAVNQSLADAPEQVNDNPFTTWLFCIKPHKPQQLDDLLSAAQYQSTLT